MLSFKSYLEEGFVNAILAKDDASREKYASQVWDILQQSYAKIGGIKGSGFSSINDMIARIPFWKLYLEGDGLRLAVLYKDSKGRKLVAIGTDGSAKARRVLSDVMRESFRVSFGEYSKGLLVFILKNVPESIVLKYVLTPAQIADILDDTIIVPTQEYVNDNLEKSDQALYNRFKKWHKYFYVRSIGGKPFLKIAIGSPNLAVT
jgi:hypothetical protein